MSESVAHEKSGAKSRSLFSAVLIITTVVGPHTLQISSASNIDASFLQLAMFSVFWTASYETGSTIAGPYVHTVLEFLSNPALILSVLFLPLYLIVILAQMRFMSGNTSRKSVMRVVALTLTVQTFVLFAFFWYRLDGWAFAQSYPLPIVHVLVVLSVAQKGKSESIIEADSRDLDQKHHRISSKYDLASISIVTICFSCVCLLFVMVGVSLIFNFFSAMLLQPAYAFGQLLIGLGFLVLGVISIIMYMKSGYGR